MQCPNDGSVLIMSERSGVEIDYCPTCRGVWLDRGELDKILDRAALEGVGQPPQASSARLGYTPPDPRYPPPAEYSQPAPRYDKHGQDSHGGDNRKRRREGWFSELFD